MARSGARARERARAHAPLPLGRPRRCREGVFEEGETDGKHPTGRCPLLLAHPCGEWQRCAYARVDVRGTDEDTDDDAAGVFQKNEIWTTWGSEGESASTRGAIDRAPTHPPPLRRRRRQRKLFSLSRGHAPPPSQTLPPQSSEGSLCSSTTAFDSLDPSPLSLDPPHSRVSVLCRTGEAAQRARNFSRAPSSQRRPLLGAAWAY
jgi:hypothetical protein